MTGSLGPYHRHSLLVLQSPADEPVQLMTHPSDCSIGMRELVFDSKALVHDHHCGFGVELGDGGGNTADFVAERFVEAEEVMGC